MNGALCVYNNRLYKSTEVVTMLADALAAPLSVADAADSSIDDLDRAIVTLAARVNAASHA